jgi:hypothetical protein
MSDELERQIMEALPHDAWCPASQPEARGWVGRCRCGAAGRRAKVLAAAELHRLEGRRYVYLDRGD